MMEPAAQALIRRLSEMNDALEEINVEFGMSLDAKVGAFIAAAAAGASFKVTLTWRRQPAQQAIGPPQQG